MTARRLPTLSWPQVAAFAVLVAGVIATLVFVPHDKLPSWEVIAAFLAVVTGGGASAFLSPMMRRSAEPARPRTDPPEAER